MSDVERELPDQWQPAAQDLRQPALQDDDVTHCPPAVKLVMGMLVPEDVMARDENEHPPSSFPGGLRRTGEPEDGQPDVVPMTTAVGPHTAGGACPTQATEAEHEHEQEYGQPDVVPMNGVAGPPRRLTAKEIAARKRNAQFAGVKTAEGKAISRLNARKHGVFASALTPLDHRELRAIYDEFAETAQPVGAIEEALVEKMSLCWLRIQRCARAEAELHADVWLPTVKELRDLRDGASDPWRRAERTGFFKPHTFERLVSLVHRYDTSLTNQMVRLMHELERLQRRRTGDLVGPPVSADVSVTGV